MATEIRIEDVTSSLESALSVSSLVPLAQGGQKYVFECKLEEFEAVAKVVMLPTGPDHFHVLERAQREVEILAAIDSPRVVSVLSEVVELEYAGAPFAAAWVEKRLDGTDMRFNLEEPWDSDRCARLLVHIGEALTAFHEQDVVHRDLSPANIRELSDGSFALMDPGLARHLAKSALTGLYQPGTPGHRSPEHVPGGDIQPVSDIFALGILAYRALTGALPIDPLGSEDEYFHRLRNFDCPAVEIMRPDMPGPMCAIINRCLQRQPARRFLDGGELLDELKLLPDFFGLHFLES
ncbi:serine/threonine protein kinase [Streptomyces millisiae]|uniref:non-specific serine/threonine protein kinase n=1 Tax=Streptomyces millisiae TaxID=3075542 RepID=A0ABU2LKG9_9ACTN|nr:protein kinase [Streptomyces sp. DSM 44918]MDT0318081.1 protein kinase [Streptomyces sp. DSM 44918]